MAKTFTVSNGKRFYQVMSKAKGDGLVRTCAYPDERELYMWFDRGFVHSKKVNGAQVTLISPYLVGQGYVAVETAKGRNSDLIKSRLQELTGAELQEVS